ALQVDRSRYLIFDLAEEWVRRTRKPFVFAFWAVRRAALKGRSHLDPASTFQQSRDHGLEAASLDALARQWSPRLAITEDDVRSYLTETIHYYLDPDCLEGLQLFYQYAEECGVIPAAPELRFLDVSKQDNTKRFTHFAPQHGASSPPQTASKVLWTLASFLASHHLTPCSGCVDWVGPVSFS